MAMPPSPTRASFRPTQWGRGRFLPLIWIKTWLDVLSASEGDNKIAWHRNTGQDTFSAQLIISTAALDAHSVFAADLNQDGSLDVLSASLGDNKVAWYPLDPQLLRAVAET